MNKKLKANVLIYVLVYSLISLIILSGALIWSYSFYLVLNNQIKSKKAFSIAESGTEIYRWYLNHFRENYQGLQGEYNFANRLGEIIGKYKLEITPPAPGSTIVKVKSTGNLLNENIEKIIEITLGIPSLAKYSVVLNSDVRFGQGTVVYGEIHSNGGIRFDGIANNLVSSALITYDDPDHSGPNEWAVHTHIDPIDPLPPTEWNNRPDIFKAGRRRGVPRIDFIGISSNLADLKNLASTSGVYIPFSGSNKWGYEIIFNENGTFSLYSVNKVFSNTNCYFYDPGLSSTNINERYFRNTWSITDKTFIATYNIPQSGIIFVEDNVWVSGKIKDKRIIVASAKFPDNPNERTNIIINNDLTYTNYDGKDVIGLIAQRNIYVGLKSENDLRIDAALIAQNGRVGRLHYSSGCGQEYIRATITVYGMIGSNLRYGFAWTDGTGYRDRILIYDYNLLYGPPPRFPLASEFYEILKFKEIK
jgi:hypothetical protein